MLEPEVLSGISSLEVAVFSLFPHKIKSSRGFKNADTEVNVKR